MRGISIDRDKGGFECEFISWIKIRGGCEYELIEWRQIRGVVSASQSHG